MTMHETTTTTEETHLLEREGGFSRRKQIASAVGVFALAIGGVAVAGSRGQYTSSPHVFFEAPRGEEGEARRAGDDDDDDEVFAQYGVFAAE